MSSHRILMDTSAIYAYARNTDIYHREAVVFVRRCLLNGAAFILADFVFFESMNLITARADKPRAILIGRELRKNPLYKWVTLDPEAELQIWDLFQQYEDKDWSYTDCGLLVLARRLGIREIFAFDSHFDQMPEIKRRP